MFLEKNEQNQSRNFELESDKADKSIQFLTYLVKKWKSWAIGSFNFILVYHVAR